MAPLHAGNRRTERGDKNQRTDCMLAYTYHNNEVIGAIIMLQTHHVYLQV